MRFSENKKRQNLKKLTAIASAVLFLDQVVKFMVVGKIFPETEIQKNYNALFGLPADFSLVFVLFFLIFTFYFIWVGLSSRSNQRQGASEGSRLPDSASTLALALILGGILGNLTDRIFYGYIIDYIYFFNLFVFNIADLAISFGAFFLGWKILRK